MDDIYGGFPNNPRYYKALHFRRYMYETGNQLTLKFNMDAEKTPLPARSQVILGNLYDSCLGEFRLQRRKSINISEELKLCYLDLKQA